MASTEKELEVQLNEAGNRLLDPPQSLDELLPLLDQIENFLSRVEQSPSESMQSALSPSLKALISNQLLKHPNVDVTVAVAACISEITRITAPEAPYDDEQMKEVFQLIVSSFENLFDKSSQSYKKRTSILETVAKVRSCVVMLDLECDALILEMFQHFFKAAREHQPENVFSAMETIMTLVLEESEDISLELLSPILDSVKKANEEVLPLAHKLGEKVLERCATKLKPCLEQSVKSLEISLDDYSTILASMCQEASGNLEQNDATSKHPEDESKSAKGDSIQVAKEEAREVAPSEQVDPAGDKSPKSVMSNGIVQAGEDDSLADSKSLKKLEDGVCSDQSKDLNNSSGEEPNNLKTEKVDTKDQKPEQATKRKGRRSSASTKSAEPSESSAVVKEGETGKSLESKSHSKDISSSPQEGHSVEAAGPSENDKEIDAKISSPKEVDDESEVAASPSPSESLRDDRTKKSGRPKKKDNLVKEVTVPTDDVPKKVSEGTSDSEAKPSRRSAKKATGGSSDGKRTTVVDTMKKESGTTGDLEMKRQSAKKVESIKNSGGSSSKHLEDKKQRRSRGKVISAKDEDKEMVSSPRTGAKSTKNEQDSLETPKTSSKRKRTPGKENVSNIKEYDEGLVGSRVKVLWPKDRTYYKGVVDSFDPVKKKHKIMYDDGDEEILNLKRETFDIIEDDSDKDEEEGNDLASPNASAEIPPKKKGKTSAGGSTKLGKMNVSSKSGGGATSSKSKGASSRTGRKTKESSKVDSKSKDSKSVGKSEDEVGRKSKDHTSKIGSSKSDTAAKISKSKNSDTPKTSKSKDDDVSTTKSSAKPKQETPRTGRSKQETSNAASASKGKSTKGGGKSNVNGTGKMKSGSSKTKDDENSEDSTKAAEDTKGKTPNSPKAQGSEAKTGKKRRRGQN